MKTKWHWYIPDHGSVDDAESFLSFETEPAPAVERICEREFSNWEYLVPDSIMIRKDGDTEWLEFECEVESIPQFSAFKK